jgi:hypothetical protein
MQQWIRGYAGACFAPLYCVTASFSGPLRLAGVVIRSYLLPLCRCESGYELRAGLCYKKCDPGWSDDGALACTRNDCTADEEDNGAGLCYPRCAPGYRSFVTMCIEENCPGGYRNDPLSCWWVAASVAVAAPS